LQDPEPFGLVQVEAMLCGTPVVATRIGAAPEVIDEGITGYCAASADDFPRQVIRSFDLDRRRVRAQAEERFSAGRMAREYAEVYQHLVSTAGPGRPGRLETSRDGGWQR
jgi:glycosyltransferase involved in cell wall biosynthesis